jgi:hypothetical protein
MRNPSKTVRNLHITHSEPCNGGMFFVLKILTPEYLHLNMFSNSVFFKTRDIKAVTTAQLSEVL